jgi:RNA polymerase sigma-70 factor (ECF subfamily)
MFDDIENQIPNLRRFARYLVRNADSADDLVQECLRRAIENIDSWQHGTNIRAWLFTILRNVYRNEVRRQKRQKEFLGRQIIQSDYSYTERQETSLLLNDIRKAMDQLAMIHREILLLVAIEGLTYEEVATLLNISIGTVKSRLSRARMSLLKIIERDKINVAHALVGDTVCKTASKVLRN